METGGNYFKDVVLWHRAMDFPVRRAPISNPITESERKLREAGIRLVVEEFTELITALAADDFRGIADGGADLVWVVAGLLARYGINLDEAWKEVRRTNWAKKGGPRRADGKLLKPDGWLPPSMDAALEGIPEGDYGVE